MLNYLNKYLTRNKFWEMSLIGVAITMPFPIKFNSIAIGFLVVSVIARKDWKEQLKLVKGNSYSILLVGFFLIHFIGILYSQNVRQGWFELEKKISFLIFPFCIGSLHLVTKSVIKKVLCCFTASCFIASTICLGNGLFKHFQGDSSYLVYHKLSYTIGIHAIYFSLYIGTCLYFILIELKENWNIWTNRFKVLLVSLILYFLFFLILLSSKMLLAVIFLLFVFQLAILIFQVKGFKTSIVFFFTLIGFFLTVLISIPSVRERFTDVVTDRYNQNNPLFLDDYDGYHFTGGAIRLAIWKMCTEILNRDNAWIMGVGTGDSQDKLTAMYVQKHVYPGDDLHEGFLHYNAHNQFMQFLLTLGILGLIWFVIIVLVLLSKAIHADNPLFLYILITFIAFSLTESTLSSQKGIVFFAFFTSLLMPQLKQSQFVANNDR